MSGTTPEMQNPLYCAETDAPPTAERMQRGLYKSPFGCIQGVGGFCGQTLESWKPFVTEFSPASSDEEEHKKKGKGLLYAAAAGKKRKLCHNVTNQERRGKGQNPPVFCLEPLPEEEQRRKGLFTQTRPTFSNVQTPLLPFTKEASVYPSLAARKPLFSTFDGEPPVRPFAEGNVYPSFADRHIKPEGKAEKMHFHNLKQHQFHNLKGTPPGDINLSFPFPQPDGKPEIPERCLTGAPLTPYCDCPQSNCSATTLETLSTLPAGALEEHRPNFIPIWLAYKLQTRQSHCFDIDDYPGGGTTSLRPLPPSVDFNNEAGLPLELANRAIQEYNEKECNVFKYKVLKIEKVNFSLQGSSYQYWMTVIVLNLTLATPIETFQIHAGFQSWNDERVVYCCQPKEEVIVGFESCNVCYGKLHGEGYHGGNRKGTRALVF